MAVRLTQTTLCVQMQHSPMLHLAQKSCRKWGLNSVLCRIEHASYLQKRTLLTEQNASSNLKRVALFEKLKAGIQHGNVITAPEITIQCVGTTQSGAQDPSLICASGHAAITTPREAFKNLGIISKKQEKRVALALVDDTTLWDIDRPLERNCKVELVSASDIDEVAFLGALAHSASHVLGCALEMLYPTIQLTNGPGLSDGRFYYEAMAITHAGENFLIHRARSRGIAAYIDLCVGYLPVVYGDTEVVLDATKLQQLHDAAKAIIQHNYPFERLEVSEEQAREVFADNPFKQRYITAAVEKQRSATAESDARQEMLTLYRCGPFVDLCRGPHVQSTGLIGAFELLAVSSHTHGGDDDADNTHNGAVCMHRVSGVAFPSKQKLKAWQDLQREISLRNHRRIGSEQELFLIHQCSPGSPFFLPHGTVSKLGFRIINALREFIRREHLRKDGYDEVMTPTVFTRALWQQSGHWDHYAEDMFFVSDEGHTMHDNNAVLETGLKPMNCPAHCLIFKSKQRSHRDLPVRIADFSGLFRNESSGALSGLTRVRQFHQDDGHVFCTQDQIFDEVHKILSFLHKAYTSFGFSYWLNLSTRPDKSMGTEESWQHAEQCLQDALNATGMPWDVDPGNGAFYGPKIDVTLKDALGRDHQTATIQLDFQLPERFDLEYDGADGVVERPVIVHRAILGSLERFFAILCEHTAGFWPFWISPRQVAVCPVSATHQDAARSVHERLMEEGYFSSLEDSSESLGKRLRQIRPLRYNYTVVIGDEELEGNTIAVKARDGDDTSTTMSVDQFLERLHAERNPFFQQSATFK